MPCYEPNYGRLHLTPNGVKGRASFRQEDNYEFYFNGRFPLDLLVSGRPAEKLMSVPFPCRKCFGCKKERARQWSMRCVHESKSYESSSFVTLTFSDAYIKARGHRGVDKRDVQLFMKRLRKRFSDRKIRVFYVSEYGPKTLRPHYHLLLFGIDFAEDRKFVGKSACESMLYFSDVLDAAWTDRSVSNDKIGHAWIGELNAKSAAYVAQYTMTKLSDKRLKSLGLSKEFQHMSNRPGIGRRFIEEYWQDVYPHDFCIVDGYKHKPPTYYDRILKEEISLPIFNQVKLVRLEKSLELKSESSYDRLRVRFKVANAKASLFTRGAPEASA